MSGLSLRLGALPPQRLLLVGSLALNLFFVGAAVAVGWRQAQAPALPAAVALDRSPAARIDRLAATLPGPDAKVLYAQFQAAEPTIESDRAVSRRAQEAVRRALDAPTFDPATADTALSALRDARRAVWRTLHGALLRAATEMSPEGRARLADWVPPTEEGNRPAHSFPQGR
ncbi:periplasmic heavy metal sensor [Azorhizobium sp. AG788]|uniref:periplasmic heavy metal sensor n=1 Tax=Azorhizobium sp. AG788 TaxID=2183897 RepID=UPI0031387727